MGLSCFRAISGIGWVGWDLCAGLFYEHRFVMLIKIHNMSGSTPNWTTHRIDLNKSVPHAMMIAHTMSFMRTFKGYEHSS